MSSSAEHLAAGERPLGLLDTVVLVDSLPDEGLVRGHIGTIVEVLSEGVFEVEFADLQGHTYAMVPVEAARLLRVRHQASGTPTAG